MTDGLSAADLFERHLLHALQRYRPHLEGAQQQLEANGVVPDDEPSLGSWVQTLRSYLEERTSKDFNETVLRLGLNAPGTLRGIQPPWAVLDEKRGGFSKRRLQEAADWVVRLTDALALAKLLETRLESHEDVAVLLAATLRRLRAADERPETDPIEAFSALSNAEARMLEARALAAVDDALPAVRSVGVDLLRCVAAYREPVSANITAALIDRRIFEPGVLFRDQDEATAARLLRQQVDDGDDTRDAVLAALAWTRSRTAADAFSAWNQTPPPWSATMTARPASYARLAGWRVGADGRAHDLIVRTCRRLSIRKAPDAQPVPCLRPSDEPCPHCRHPLRVLFDFSNVDGARWPTELTGAPRRVLACLTCGCFGPMFFHYFADGTSTWVAGPTDPPADVDAAPVEPVTRWVTRAPLPPFAVAEPYSLPDASTVGGLPMWLQDEEYPACDRCRLPMMFLAQHDNAATGGDGLHYAFFCGSCQTYAVTYQQT